MRWLDGITDLMDMSLSDRGEAKDSALLSSRDAGYSLPDSSVHGIFQARVLELGAIAFSTL